MNFLFKNWHVLLLAGILILAGFFRIWGLDTIPPGLYSDEAVNALDAVKTFETNDWKVFYQDNNGREGLYIWFVALAFKLFGIGILQFRIVSALIGTATVAAVYFFARELFEEKRKAEIIALASTFFIAASFWHINFSRIGFRVILLPLALTLFSYFLLRAVKSGKLYHFVLAGIVFGLGFYTYTAFRMALLIPAAVFMFEFAVYLWNVRPRLLGVQAFKKWYVADGWWKWDVFGAVVMLVILPLAWYFLQHPENFSSRANDVFIFSKENPVKEFLISGLKTLGMFNVKGDMSWRHNVSGSPQLFFPVGILFVIGFLISLKEFLFSLSRGLRKRKSVSFAHTSYFLLHASFWVMLLPAILTWEGIPHALRSIGVIPVVYVFAGIGFWEALIRLDGLRRKKKLRHVILVLLVGALLLLVGFMPFDSYRTWGEKPAVREAFSKKLVDVGNYITGTYPGTPDNTGYQFYVVDEDGPWEAGDSIAIRPIRFITHGKINPRYISFEDVPRIAIPENDKAVVIPIYRDHDIYRLILSEYGERFELTVYNKFIVLRINSL